MCFLHRLFLFAMSALVVPFAAAGVQVRSGRIGKKATYL